MNEALHQLVLTLLVLLGGAAVLLVVLLVAGRVLGGLLRRRREEQRDAVRLTFLTALLGEGEEAAAAMADLRSREGRDWQLAEEQAFALLPKIKGDSRDSLVRLLQSRGATTRAYANARSRSVVVRARGAYQLGALGEREALTTLFTMLEHRHFLVRRTVVRALGQIQDPLAVPPLLEAVSDDPTLSRDVVAALQRIGPPGGPYLRRDLEHLIISEEGGRRGTIVATTLGLNGDVAATLSLVRALRSGSDRSLRAAAAGALGAIGVRTAVPSLVDALADVPEVRVRAAAALGMIGEADAVPDLAGALDSGVHVVDRAVAAALLRLGKAGHEALLAHRSPYAREALAVHGLRSPA